MPGAYGSPKTHFSEQPCFLGTLDDHENERISFPALFCSKLNNESGILAAVCRTNCPHWSYCSQWLLTWRLGHWPKNKHDSWHCSWCERKKERATEKQCIKGGEREKKKKGKITTSLTVKYTVAALHHFKLDVKMLQMQKRKPIHTHAMHSSFWRTHTEISQHNLLHISSVNFQQFHALVQLQRNEFWGSR